MAEGGWNMAGGEMTPLLFGTVIEAERTGAGLFLISCFRHLARRFWNQTCKKHQRSWHE